MNELNDFFKAMAEAKATDPKHKKIAEVKEHIKEDLGGLFSQISEIKAQDPVAQKAKKIEAQVKTNIKEDLGSLFAELGALKVQKDAILEERPELAEPKLEEPEVVNEEVLIEVAPIEEAPKPINVDKYLTGKTFQQPEPDPVAKEFKVITDKMKFLEQAIAKIAAHGPGSGEVNLRYLDDVDRSSIVDGWFLKYNATIKKFDFASPTAASFNPTDIRAVYAEVKNADTVTIHKGDPVYLYRSTGNKASVILAGNTGDATSAKTLGLAYADFAPGQTGLVITKGVLTGVDTQMYAEGDTLYLGATAGTLTNVKPYSPNHLVYIGVVERANQGQGQIYVSPQNGYELEELHNVNIDNLVALDDGHYLRWNDTAQQWVNEPFPILFSGSYNDLTNKPTLFSGSYTDLTNKPTIPSLTGYATESYVSTAISNLIGAAPSALDTLKEIADQLATDESAVSSLTTAVAGKVSLTGSYANPSWITSLAYSKLTDVPTPDKLLWRTTSPSPGGSYQTLITANDGNATISASTGLANLQTIKSWTFNTSGQLVFPDSSTQTTAWTGTYSYNDLTNKPSLFSGSYTDLTNKPSLFSGSYTDLTNKPTLFSGAGSALTGTSLASGIVSSSLTSVGTLSSLTVTGTVTSNHTTAFIAGDNAISGVALQIPSEGAIRNLTNGANNNMYFDVSVGGTSQGQFQFRSSSAFTNVLTMSPTAFNVNPNAVVTAKTASFGRLAWNSAIDTELTIDDYRFRVSNSGGIYPQIISNVSGQTKNSAWTAVAAISGSAVGQGGSPGTLVPNNSWTSLYTFAAMNSAGDTVTVTLQDKSQGRIYRITFMRSDNGSTTGYNIIAERLL
jgi:hypothetical protein